MSKKKIIGRFTEGDLDRLLNYICDYFQVHLDDLKGNSRMKKFATARKYCWKLLKQKGVTKKEIGPKDDVLFQGTELECNKFIHK